MNWNFFVPVFFVSVFTMTANAQVPLIPELPATWANSSRAGFTEAGEPDPVIYIVNTTTHDTPVGNSTRNGIPVRTGLLRSLLNEWVSTGKPGIVLFEVSGTIDWIDDEVFYQIGNNSGLSIIGKTAPSSGITIKDVVIRNGTSSNIFVHHIRFRPGEELSGNNDSAHRAFSCRADNTVVANCSLSWGLDINIGSGSSKGFLGYRNIINEALDASLTKYSKEALSSKDSNQAVYIQNSFAHNDDRITYLQSGTKAIINYVAYNWHQMPIIAESNTGQINANIIGNIVMTGSNTPRSVNKYALRIRRVKSNSQFYINDNRTEYKESSYMQRHAGDWSVNIRNSSGNPVSVIKTTFLIGSACLEGMPVLDVDRVETTVLTYVGARPNDRDSVDICIGNDVINGTGKIIDYQDDAGGWPGLIVNTVILKDLTSSPHGNDDGDGYTNSEKWLHAKSDALMPLRIASPDPSLKRNVQLMAYPNPSTGKLVPRLNKNYDTIRLELTDSSGKKTVRNYSYISKLQVDFSMLPDGIYCYTLYLGGSLITTGKWIKIV